MTEIMEHKGLDEALLHAQAEYPPLEKGTQVKVKTKSGGEYTYNYATLAYTREVTDPYLRKHGLVVKESAIVRDGVNIITATLSHASSGEMIYAELDVSTDGDMKDLGGNITYARRYLYWLITGRIGEDDSEPRDLPRRSNSQPRQGSQKPPGTKPKAPAGQKAQGESGSHTKPPDEVIKLKNEAAQLQAKCLRDNTLSKAEIDNAKNELFGGLAYPDNVDKLKAFIATLEVAGQNEG